MNLVCQSTRNSIFTSYSQYNAFCYHIYFNCMQENFKKSVGFIKNPSNRNIQLAKQHNSNSSSASFSSFQKDKQHNQENFSPYRNNNPPHQANQKDSRKSLPGSKGGLRYNERAGPSFGNKMLRNNFTDEIRQDSKPNIKQIKSGQVYSSDQSEGVRQYSESQEIQFRGDSEELSFKNIRESKKKGTIISNKFSSTQSINPTSLGKLTHKYQKQFQQKKKFEEYSQESSFKSQDQLIEYDNNYKLTVKEHQSKDFSNKNMDKDRQKDKGRQNQRTKMEDQQKLIVQYDKRYFKDKSLKTAILNHHKYMENTQKKDNKNVKQSRGGICFELDKHQFTLGPDPRLSQNPRKPKMKKKEVNSRDQVLLRRERAKLYDKMSRSKIFRY